MDKPTEVDNTSIGERIQHERKILDLTRAKFAEIVGLSEYYVGQLERGERQMSLPVLVNIANCLHISIDYLVWGKTHNISYFVNDSSKSYTSFAEKQSEISSLLTRCSPKELDLIKRIIKTILPYVNR